jgi:hypothetical protein
MPCNSDSLLRKLAHLGSTPFSASFFIGVLGGRMGLRWRSGLAYLCVAAAAAIHSLMSFTRCSVQGVRLH